MKIALASDHAGFRYKGLLRGWLEDLGHEVHDLGCHVPDQCDYPDFVVPLAKAIANREFDRGIVLGGSGNGEAMAANRVKGVRCALCWTPEVARLSRRHNNANVLSLGERLLTWEEVTHIVAAWLEEPFDGERHVRRIEKLDELT